MSEIRRKRYGIRKVESIGPRGGIAVEWQTFSIAREADHDGGWCQTYASRRDAIEGLEWLEAQPEEIVD